MDIGKINTYQRTFLIVAGSLLALLVLIAVAGTSGGQHLQSSANNIAKDAVTLVDFQADSTNLALTKDIFGFGVVSENDEGCVGPCVYHTEEKPCKDGCSMYGDGCNIYPPGRYCKISFDGCYSCSF